MKAKTLVIVLLICFSYSILVNGDTTTTGLISDSDSLPSGYFVSYTRSISHSSTTVQVSVTSSGYVDVAVCGGGEFDDWNNGGPEPYFHSYRSDITSTTISLTLGVGSYDFVIINFGYSSVSYTITATQSYYVPGGTTTDPSTDPSTDSGDWVYGLIALGIIPVIIIGLTFRARRRRRRRPQVPTQPGYYQQQQTYQTYQPQRTYEPQQTYQSYQPTEQPPPAYDQTPLGLKVCQNCGFNEQVDSKFCTSCGSKL